MSKLPLAFIAPLGTLLLGIGIGDWRASSRVRAELADEIGEARADAHENDHRLTHQSEQIARLLALVRMEYDRRTAIENRLEEIDGMLQWCTTIIPARGDDGVWTFTLVGPDGSAREVVGRTVGEMVP